MGNYFPNPTLCNFSTCNREPQIVVKLQTLLHVAKTNNTRATVHLGRGEGPSRYRCRVIVDEKYKNDIFIAS